MTGDSANETSSLQPATKKAEPYHKEVPPRKDAALVRLGVTPEQLRDTPQISEMLREVRNGRSIAIRAMRFSQQQILTDFLVKYDSIPERDREQIPLEAIAISIGQDVRHLWGEIMLAIRESSVNAVKIIAVAAHPDVLKKRVEFAKTPGGYRDRDALDIMLGALPSPKGPTFIGKAFFGSTTPEPDDPDGAETPVQAAPQEELVSDEDFVFPDCEVMQEKVQPMRKLLEAKR